MMVHSNETDFFICTLTRHSITFLSFFIHYDHM